jgi:hypothetical protein
MKFRGDGRYQLGQLLPTQCRVLRKLYNSAKDATAKSVRSLHSGDTRKYSLHAEHVNPHLHWEPHGFLTADRFKLASIEPVQVDAAVLFIAVG